MQKRQRREGGQALVIIAFAIMGLFAITGLAVDGGMSFSDRRHAQNAADTAAMAGALARLHAYEVPGWTELEVDAKTFTEALNLANLNGYDDNLISNDVEVHMCDDLGASCPAPYAGDDEYVQVVITSHVNTYFARLIGVPQVHNRVQAIALADDDDSGSLYNGDSIVSLAPECQAPDNFIVQGTANILIEGGGLFVNTEGPDCGFKCETSSGTITGNITTAGGALEEGMSAHCQESVTGDLSQDADPWDFPVTLDDLGIPYPDECDGPAGTYTNYGLGLYPGFPEDPVTVLTPGSYVQFPPKKEQPLGDLEDHIFMLPGVYCVDDAIKLTTDNRHFIGHDVTIFVRAGSGFRFEGGELDIDAPNSGDYAGYLIIVEPDYDGSPVACTINGNSNNSFIGAIFAPYCDVSINGTEDTYGYESQIIGYTVKITGGGYVNFEYDAEENPVTNQPPELGLVH